MTRRIAGTLLALTSVLLVLAVVPLAVSMTARERVSYRDNQRAATRVIAAAAEEHLSDHKPATDASRLHRRTALLPDRGACRHPDGAARLAASALHTFAEDVERHLTHGVCEAARRTPRIPVPPATPPEGWR